MTKIKIFHIFYLIVFLCGLSSISLADDVQFRADVNKRKVRLNQNFKVTFTLKNAKGKDFQPPAFKYFQVVGGPNRSSSMRIINGNVSRSIKFSYFLRPEKKGKFSIGPAKIKVNGQIRQTNSINITVVEGGSAQKNRQGDDSQNKSIEAKINDNLFLKLYVNNTEVYQGEQITATYKLYTRYQIGRTRLSKTPSFTGFWSEDIQQPKNLDFQQETYQGKQFKTAVLASVALFPQRTGTLTLDPMKLETTVRVPVKKRRRSVFDDFFGSYKDVKHKFQSNKVNVKVNPLPDNKPENFSGAVGDFNYNVSLDRKKTKVEEPITVSVRISGTGNLKLMDAPELDLPSDFEVYDPKVKSNISSSGGQIKGSKTYDYLVVPHRRGEYKLPSLTFSYFNTKTEDYETITSPEHTITVTGQAKASSSASGNVSQDEVEVIGKDIRYIKSGNIELRPKGYFMPASISFLGLYALPPLMFVLALLYRDKKQREGKDTITQRRKRANKIARKRLSHAQKLIDDSREKPFYDEVMRALWGYLADKLNIEQAQLSQDKVVELLHQYRVPQDKIDELTKVLDDCEMALFAPSADGANKQQVYSQATEVITNLEQHLT